MSFITIRNKIAGFRDTLAFSNRWAIIAHRLFHPSYPIVAYLWKARWWLFADMRYLDANAPKELLANGSYDLWIVESSLQGSLCYVNVGANIGAFDIAVAGLVERIPAALSIELNPVTFIRLCFNLQINKLHNVKTLNVGVGAIHGLFNFHASGCSLSDSLYQTGLEGPQGKDVQIPILTLSESISQVGMADREFDLLKLDCEGAEYAIVRESSPECLSLFRNIVIELHPEPAGESVASLYEKLTACGFYTEQPRWVSSPRTELRFWRQHREC